jgi:hypothetical protein
LGECLDLIASLKYDAKIIYSGVCHSNDSWHH